MKINYKNYKKTFLMSMLTCVSLGVTACSNNKDLELTGKYKYSPQTNNFYNESNFYGVVTDVEEIFSKNEKKKLYSKVTVEGERGTVVTVKTKDHFDVGDNVLFKSALNKKNAHLTKVKDKNRTDSHASLAENQPPEYYRDISKVKESKDNLYKNTSGKEVYKEFHNANIKLY